MTTEITACERPARWLAQADERATAYRPPVLEIAQSRILDALEALEGIEPSYRTRAIKRSLRAAWDAIADGRDDFCQTEVSSGS